MEIDNKIALVTGANRGLGKDMVLKLAKSGVDIIVAYHNHKDEAEAVAAEIQNLGRKAITMQLDISKTKSFDVFYQELFENLDQKWNRTTFDYLINNEGNDLYSLFPDTTEEDFDNLMNVHFKGVFFLTQKALPFIADNGRIINVSTGLTRFATPGYSAYASMKGAVEILTKYLAKELGHRKITANLVVPGIMKTNFTKAAFESHPELEKYVSSVVALEKVGLPTDVGEIVVFLCSDSASWVTAQRLETSGGAIL